MAAITYSGSEPIEGTAFVCRRCRRSYAYPAPGSRPIRCECGWWYFNDGGRIREAYCQRIEPYRTPADLRRLFAIG